MRFRDALQVAQAPVSASAERVTVDLLCGFTPDQFRTFLIAQLRTRTPDRLIDGRVGLFGDLTGNLERAAATGSAPFVVVPIEWADLDARLGVRGLGGWSPEALGDIVAGVEAQLVRMTSAVERIAATSLLAVSLPTLPLPPVSWLPRIQAGLFEARLRAAVAEATVRLAGIDRVRVVDVQVLDERSPLAERQDVRAALTYGYPYAAAHAAALSGIFAALLDPPAPKKGLITDLDDTFWRGILGEVGVEQVSWDLEHHSQGHGLYQQLLKSLADAGVLIAVASKNDQGRVDEAFRRTDLVMPASQIFPLTANWGPKSASVAGILAAWNVGADSVVFVDDSPLELAEVAAAHPAVTTLHFPKDDAGVYRLLEQLRDLFGKPALSAEDAVRLESLRRGAEVAEAMASADPEAFLSSIDPVLTVSFEVASGNLRPLELINKTNQFNLNGRRLSEPEWIAHLADPEAFVATIGYRDKFGPLGTIAVVAGRRRGATVVVEHWVMSCRAFSRRIEHATVALLLERFGAEALQLEVLATARNAPLQEYLQLYRTGEATLAPGFMVTRTQLSSVHPTLYHRIEDSGNG